MKEENMIVFKTDSNVGPNNFEKNFLEKICHSIKEPAFIGSLNGSVSGAIAAILATYGYISLPGFGPIIAMGIGLALFAGTIIGAIIGSIIGVFLAYLVFLWETYIHHDNYFFYKSRNE